MAVTEYYYHFVVHFYCFIDRPLLLFALFCMIVILFTDTFILLYIFTIGSLEKKVFLYGYSKLFSDVISK